MTHSQNTPPRPVLTFVDDVERGLLLAHCPACGALALEIANAHQVRCSYCGFESQINRFLIQHRDAMHTPIAADKQTSPVRPHEACKKLINQTRTYDKLTRF